MFVKKDIEEFLQQKALAVVGVSRSHKKFPYTIYKELKSKGYQVYAVNPNTDSIDAEPCYSSISSLPGPVDGVVILVPPSQSEKVIKDAHAAGIKHIWIQQGAESKEALDYCEKEGIKAIHSQCVLMFAEPAAFPHKLHRCIARVFGKIPS